MQDLIPVHYESSRCLTWFHIDDDDDDATLYISTDQSGSYDDSYYLTYDQVDDTTERKNCWTNADYKQNYRGECGSCWLQDYTCYFGCDWGGNDLYPEQEYEISYLDWEGSPLNEGTNSFTYNDDNENQWLGYDGLDDDVEWVGTTLYDRILAY